MPATASTHHLLARAERRLVDFDPATDGDELAILDPVNAVECLPLQTHRRYLAGYSPTVGTGGITAFQIVAATSAAGVGATVVREHALGSNPDAVTDYVWLECTVEQCREVLATATHIGVRLNLVTGTDEGKVYLERSEATFSSDDETEDYIA